MVNEINLTDNQAMLLLAVLLAILGVLLRYTGKRTIGIKPSVESKPEPNQAYLERYGYYIQSAGRIND